MRIVAMLCFLTVAGCVPAGPPRTMAPWQPLWTVTPPPPAPIYQPPRMVTCQHFSMMTICQ